MKILYFKIITKFFIKTCQKFINMFLSQAFCQIML